MGSTKIVVSDREKPFTLREKANKIKPTDSESSQLLTPSITPSSTPSIPLYRITLKIYLN